MGRRNRRIKTAKKIITTIYSSMKKFRLKRYLATVIYLNKKGKAKVFVFAVAFLLKIKERIGQELVVSFS